MARKKWSVGNTGSVANTDSTSSTASTSSTDREWLVKHAVRRVFSSPHIFARRSSAQIMWSVSACLLPAAFWGAWRFGWRAVGVLLLATTSCVAAEALVNLLGAVSNTAGRLYRNRPGAIHWTVGDGSAALSGLLLGMSLAPFAPWYIPPLGGLFAMLVGKWSFGGLGANWMNPALVGYAFVLFSFGQELTVSLDASSVATPLALLASAKSPGALPTVGEALTEGLDVYKLFFGLHSGAIGEVATLLLLLGGLALLALGIISWHIPAAYLLSFSLLVWAVGGLQWQGLWQVLAQLGSGGLMLGAWFMATDYSSSPKMPLAKLIFGTGCGVLSFLIRFYGSYPEGVMLAILFMNICTPTLDLLIQPRVFGSGRKRSRTARRQSILNLPKY